MLYSISTGKDNLLDTLLNYENITNCIVYVSNKFPKVLNIVFIQAIEKNYINVVNILLESNENIIHEEMITNGQEKATSDEMKELLKNQPLPIKCCYIKSASKEK